AIVPISEVGIESGAASAARLGSTSAARHRSSSRYRCCPRTSLSEESPVISLPRLSNGPCAAVDVLASDSPSPHFTRSLAGHNRVAPWAFAVVASVYCVLGGNTAQAADSCTLTELLAPIELAP